jgi:FtsZ-binding cell division protein ZapB
VSTESEYLSQLAAHYLGEANALRRKVAELEARIEEMNELVDHVEEESGARDYAALEAEVERLKAATYCAYCGERFELDDENASIGAHIKMCPKHPMRAVEAEVERLKAEAEGWEEVLADLARQIKINDAHTWQQERAAVVEWIYQKLSACNKLGRDMVACSLPDRIEAGEHWPEGGTP